MNKKFVEEVRCRIGVRKKKSVRTNCLVLKWFGYVQLMSEKQQTRMVYKLDVKGRRDRSGSCLRRIETAKGRAIRSRLR